MDMDIVMDMDMDIEMDMDGHVQVPAKRRDKWFFFVFLDILHLLCLLQVRM